MKTIVFEPRACRALRASSISVLDVLDRRADVAENVTNRARVVLAMIRASVVFPEPGGPQKIIEGMRSLSMALRRKRPFAEELFEADDLFERSRAEALGERSVGAAWRAEEASSKREPVIESRTQNANQCE